MPPPPYFNSYRSHLEKNCHSIYIAPTSFTSAPRGACVCGSWATYKLIVTKNKFAASDEVISFRMNDQSYSLIGFNQYVIKNGAF